MNPRTKDTINAEALEAIGNKHRAGCSVSMGVGKTLIGLRHMEKNYTDISTFLVVAPKLSIFESWREDAEKFGLGYLLDHIKFSTYLSLHKQATDYDIVYLDECHNILETHVPWLDSYGNKILGLTGTPPRNSYSVKAKIIEQYCPIVYIYDTDTAVKDNILNDYKIVLHGMYLDTRRNIKVEKAGKTWMSSEHLAYDYWDKQVERVKGTSKEHMARIMRMKSLMDAKTKVVYAKALLDKSKEKTIVFANTREQAEFICKHSYHSTNPNSQDNLKKFKSGAIMKMSAVLQISEGVNIQHLKEGIVLHAYANERKFAQRLGRLMRLNPNDRALIHILYYKDTVDELWITQALEDFDQSKIIWK